MDCAIAQSLTVRTFRAGTDKEAALKPLEEAAEAYGAWQRVNECMNDTTFPVCPNCADEVATGGCYYGANLADELADCITACCNLAARYGLDLQAAIDRVEERNRERGRYGSQD